MPNYDDLDLPYDPLEEAPAVGGSTAFSSALLIDSGTQKYSPEAVNILRSGLSPYNKYAESLTRKRHRLGLDVASENLKASRLNSLAQLSALSRTTGKMGFAGSGAQTRASDYFKGDVSRATTEIDIAKKKGAIGAKEQIMGMREEWVDEQWDAYSAWLRTSPEEYSGYDTESGVAGVGTPDVDSGTPEGYTLDLPPECFDNPNAENLPQCTGGGWSDEQLEYLCHMGFEQYC